MKIFESKNISRISIIKTIYRLKGGVLDFVIARQACKQNRQKGIALLITMILLGTVIATSLGVAVLVTGESGINRLVSDSVKAIFAADAGMEKLLYFANKLNGDPATADFKKNLETGDTGFITCPNSSACYFACEAVQNCTSNVLRSRGQMNTARRSLEASY